MIGEKSALFGDVIRALSMSLDFDEGAKLYHAWRVGVLSYEMGRMLELPEVEYLYYAGLLHDIGAIGLGHHVTHYAKNDFELEEAHGHPRRGAEILEQFSVFRKFTPYILAHHEHYDGCGFPEGLRENEIPVQASCILMADMLDLALFGGSGDPIKKTKFALEKIEKGRETLFPSFMCETAQSLLESKPELIVKMSDETALQKIIYSLNFVPPEIESMPIHKALAELLWTFARVIDAKHSYTAGHSTRVAYYAHRISLELGPSEVNSWDVIWAGLLHDVGKVGTPRQLLDKNGPLTAEEWPIVKKHAFDSVSIISTIGELAHLAYPAASHHERYCGGGYPLGKSGEEIPLIGRILMYADVYDALTSERAYRKQMSHDAAVDIMVNHQASSLDPHLMDVAMETLAKVGGKKARLPITMDGFCDLFSVGDNEGEVGGECSPTIKKSYSFVSKGALLLEAEQWANCRVDKDLNVVRGAERMRGLFECDEQCGNLRNHLDSESIERLGDALTHLDTDETHTMYIYTDKGTPLETLIVKKPDGFQLNLRNAHNPLQNLRRMAFFYRNFFASSEAVMFVDSTGSIMDVNRTFLDLYGYSLKDIVGKRFDVILTGVPATISKREDLVDNIISKRQGKWTGESIHRTSAGEFLYVIVTLNSITDATGLLMGYVLHVLDISERKKLEDELAQMAMFAQMSPGPVLRADFNGKVYLANEVAKNIIGEEKLKRPIQEIFPELSFEEYQDMLAGERVLNLHTKIDELYYEFKIKAQPNGQFANFYGTEVTERRRAEMALQKSEYRYRLLAEHATDCIWTLDLNLHFTYISPSSTKLFGYSPEEMSGMGVSALIPLESMATVKSEVAETMKKAFRRRAGEPLPVTPFEVMIKRRDGSVLWTETIGNMMLDASGDPIGIVGVTRDITERKLIEEELMKKDRELERKNEELQKLDRLKSDLMAITSHDLKSPLNAVINYATLAKDFVGTSRAEKIPDYLGRIEQSGRRMANFIAEMLDLAKIESGSFEVKPSEIDLAGLLKSSVEMNSVTAKPRGVSITFKTEGRPKTVLADPLRMEQVFNNIISNAVKFTGENTTIEAVYSQKDDERVIITVSDEGPGIPESHLDIIFDRYYQVRDDAHSNRQFGIGLGLYIVKNIVLMHGGTVYARNRSPRGCSFTVELPVLATELSEAPLKVMVVDAKGSLWTRLEEPFKTKKIAAKRAREVSEMESSMEKGGFDAIFVNDVDPTCNVIDMIKKSPICEKPGHVPLVRVTDGTCVEGEPCMVTLVNPVLDSELFEVIEGIMMKKTAGASPQ